ncbi:MAG: alkaline phosphatase family protein [Spirosomaceae bacterium]|nr:alkaline phosphatase family protein [Spirosomataceae bacterium]
MTGFPDEEIDSNNKNYNKNVTVLEFLNKQKGYEGKVAAFTSWDVFPYIINESRSGVPVNSGVEMISGKTTEGESLLNDIQTLYPSLASSRHDFVTYFAAKEYVKQHKPKVLFLSFDETDEFAHQGKYREYLYAANTVDGFIKNLWEYCQSQPEYANKTTFIITTDHGRGDEIKDEWRSHGQKIKDCRSIWLAAIGPNISAKGEVKTSGQLYQNQIAQTIANLLGFKYENGHEIGEAMGLD